MKAIRRGSRGAAVKSLQKALEKLGFDPGGVDGAFGKGTERALKRFQKKAGLTADGVAGNRTFKALSRAGRSRKKGNAKGKREMKEKIKKKTKGKAGEGFTWKAKDVRAAMFPDAPMKNVKLYLPAVLAELARAKLDDPDMVLMALATIRAETAGFAPIDEFKSRYNTSKGGKSFDLYDNRKDIGNRGKPDGATYKGRGFIQLTGCANYKQIGKKIGAPLLTKPKLANDPVIAARILATFLKAKEKKIRRALKAGDLKTARRLVNGGSHGLAQFSACYKTGRKLVDG